MGRSNSYGKYGFPLLSTHAFDVSVVGISMVPHRYDLFVNTCSAPVNNNYRWIPEADAKFETGAHKLALLCCTFGIFMTFFTF